MRLCPHPVGRTIGVSHRVGALVVPRRLRPLYCPWPRFFARFPGEFSAACTSPCCALRGISGGATVPYRSPGRFRFPHPTRPGFFLCTLDYEPAKPVHKKHNARRYRHPLAGGPGRTGRGYTDLHAGVNFRFKEFSEVPPGPDPMRQGFLCRVSEMRSLMYIRLR